MKQIELEVSSIEDVIDKTLEFIESDLHILYEPRYTAFGYESCFMCNEKLQIEIICKVHSAVLLTH